MYFIILTTAMVLHKHGMTRIDCSRQVAEALRPLAGALASLLYTIGIIGVGFLAIPTHFAGDKDWIVRCAALTISMPC